MAAVNELRAEGAVWNSMGVQPHETCRPEIQGLKPGLCVLPPQRRGPLYSHLLSPVFNRSDPCKSVLILQLQKTLIARSQAKQ